MCDTPIFVSNLINIVIDIMIIKIYCQALLHTRPLSYTGIFVDSTAMIFKRGLLVGGYMACMEHWCLTCGKFWNNNKEEDTCSCGSKNIRSIYDETVGLNEEETQCDW